MRAASVREGRYGHKQPSRVRDLDQRDRQRRRARAFRKVYEKEIEGFGEAVRMLPTKGEDLDDSKAGHRRGRRGTYLFALPAARRLPRRLGRYSQVGSSTARFRPQPGRADAAAMEHLKASA